MVQFYEQTYVNVIRQSIHQAPNTEQRDDYRYWEKCERQCRRNHHNCLKIIFDLVNIGSKIEHHQC